MELGESTAARDDEEPRGGPDGNANDRRNEAVRRLARLLGSPRLRLGALAAVLVGASVGVALTGGPSPERIGEAVDDAGPAAPLLFVLLYAILTVLFFPGAVITGAGGLLFGTALGMTLSVVGATLGATAAFLLGRRLGREQVERLAGERVAAVDRWVERNGFLAILYLRLIPAIPFNALNYASGVSALAARDFVLGTAIGIIPGAFAFAALGGSIDDPTAPEFLAAVALILLLALGGPLIHRTVQSRRGADEADGPEPRQASG